LHVVPSVGTPLVSAIVVAQVSLGGPQPLPLQKPDVHTMPHDPQLFGFVVVSTQLPLQNVCPLGHVHTPEMHVCPPPQA
jgi:hypothetical protein